MTSFSALYADSSCTLDGFLVIDPGFYQVGANLVVKTRKKGQSRQTAWKQVPITVVDLTKQGRGFTLEHVTPLLERYFGQMGMEVGGSDEM